MIVQAVALLDDLDKELNNYAMRLKEWFGWHFPELGEIITDIFVYSRVVELIKSRKNLNDNKDSMEELIEKITNDADMCNTIVVAADRSMGVDITDDDIFNINSVAVQVSELKIYREELATYLKNRMMMLAPNLTMMVGEIVGAKLIAHAGSLLNLAKNPASTVQILGAEKALFRAIKTKQNTPK